MATNDMSIKVKYSHDGMWGDAGSAGYDVKASYAKFEEMVETKLQQEFPGAEIEFVNGIEDKSTVDSDTSTQDAHTVQYLVNRVWESWDWLVEAE